MHESYDDDNYDDSQDYDQSQSDWSKFYFKFDVTSNPLSEWIKKTIDKIISPEINTISGFPFVSLPVNDVFSNTVSGGNSLLYLGNNHYNEPIYKSKHFIENKLFNMYTNHIQQYSVHFIKQPSYYKGLYDILN